jgi:hypothetical protein
VTGCLADEERAVLVSVPEGRAEVVRAIFSAGGPKPTLSFEYDVRPTSLAEARRMVQDRIAAVAPVLGDTARELGFVAGGPHEIATFAAAGEVLHERL